MVRLHVYVAPAIEVAVAELLWPEHAAFAVIVTAGRAEIVTFAVDVDGQLADVTVAVSATLPDPPATKVIAFVP